LEFSEEIDAAEARRQAAFLGETHSLARVETEHVGHVCKDPVHGWILLNDPPITDLMATPAFERLWRVQQFGDRWATASLLRCLPHSRAEHSLGTYELIRHHGPPDRALHIAALLHDAGHTAFSHHGEAVFDDAGQQEWHESQLERIITQDRYGVRPVLDSHGISEVEVLANLAHPLLDRPKPDLCADRLDYILRDGIAANFISSETAEDVLAELRVTKGDFQWYFETPWSADVLERLLAVLETAQYSNPMMREVKHQTVGLLQHGIDRGYLEEADIAEGTDDSVLEKLWSVRGEDRELDRLLVDFVELGIPRDATESMGHVMDNFPERFREFDLPQKRRMIDPLCGNSPECGKPGRDLRPLSEWRKEEYDWTKHTGKPIVHLPGHPFMNHEEAKAFQINNR